MINYRSFMNLSQDILGGIHRIPFDIDLVVGIPRSGLLAATQIALLRNLHVCSVQDFLQNIPLEHGHTRPTSHAAILYPRDARRILVVDDSIASGGSLEKTRRQLSESGPSTQFLFAAVYATPEAASKVDYVFCVLSMPRVFQWNLLHRGDLDTVYFDMDGIFCLDPTPEENDDGPRYEEFIKTARPLMLPTRKIGGIITSRLEKYRSGTTEWLERHGIKYEHLFMLDLPDAQTRRKLNAHGAFKAKVYASLKGANLYVESETEQAAEIFKLSKKPVIDFYGGYGLGLCGGISTKDKIKAWISNWISRKRT